LAYEVKRAAFQEYAEQVWGWDEDRQWELHMTRFSAQEFFVVRYGGQAVGILAIVLKPGELTLNQLFLLPEFQGRGLGRDCMTWVAGLAGERTISLSVLKVNPRAARFYESIGFEPTGETETHIQMQRKSGPRPPD
jgi:ribosomal protein S18 acetylase RimI-like enzyme